MVSVRIKDGRAAEGGFEILVRIASGYLAACLVCGASVVLLSLAMEGAGEPVAGRSVTDEVLQYIGVAGIFAFFTAVFAAPVALAAIAVTELAMLRNPAIYALLGGLATSPALFRTGALHSSDIPLLVPAGVFAGLTFWFVRRRLWKH